MKENNNYSGQRRVRAGFEEHNLVEEYIDVFGDTIRTYKSGNKEILNGSNGLRDQVPGSKGHAFMEGNFIINEEGKEVSMFDDNDEYTRIVFLYEYKDRLKRRLYKYFTNDPLMEGPNNTVCIGDREIVPNCFWGLPTNDEEVQLKYDEIIEKVKSYKS